MRVRLPNTKSKYLGQNQFRAEHTMYGFNWIFYFIVIWMVMENLSLSQHIPLGLLDPAQPSVAGHLERTRITRHQLISILMGKTFLVICRLNSESATKTMNEVGLYTFPPEDHISMNFRFLRWHFQIESICCAVLAPPQSVLPFNCTPIKSIQFNKCVK